MKKIVLILLLIALMIITPFVAVGAYAFSLSPFYEQSYLGAMTDKYNRLNSIDSPKIILVGGSSMAFGIDSTVLETELGMPVVNMALYAAIGSKTTLELTKSNVNKGDIIIFAPETDSQAYSMYFDAMTTLQMLDANKNMFWQLPVKDQLNIFANLPNYFEQRRQHTENGKPNPTNAYSRQAFNEYGDNVFDRPYNVMLEGYLPDNLIDINQSIVDNEFVEYFNDFVSFAKLKKAQVMFSFAPMNRLALTERSTLENRLNFYYYVINNFDCPVISNVEDYIMDEGYFYDSNYHLNNSGVTYRTYTLISDVKRYQKDYSPIDYTILPPSGNQPIDDSGIIEETPDADYDEIFDYQEDAYGIKILSVKEEARNLDKLVVPSSINSKIVNRIASDAFVGINAVEIVLPNTMSTLEDGLFGGLDNLSRVTLNLSDNTDDGLPTVSSGLFNNANPMVKIYVPKSRYGQMITDYFWSAHASRIAAMN